MSSQTIDSIKNTPSKESGYEYPFEGIPRSAGIFKRLMKIYGGAYSEGHVRKILHGSVDNRTGKPYASLGKEHRVYKSAVKLANLYWQDLEEKEEAILTPSKYQ